MAIEAKRKEGESVNSLIYRFTKKIQRSGILKEARKRRFKERPQNKRKRLLSALYKVKKEKEIEKMKKYGLI